MTGVALAGVGLDSGDLLDLSRRTRELLDQAGMFGARIVVSGDLEEHQIAQLTAAGAPIDTFGVGTDLGTSRDSPVVNGVYKLVAHQVRGTWRDVCRRSPEKATMPGAKQVFRHYADAEMCGDLIARVEEPADGEPLLRPFVRGGRLVCTETIAQMSMRARSELSALPNRLRKLDGAGGPYPVAYSDRCRRALAVATAATGVAQGSLSIDSRGTPPRDHVTCFSRSTPPRSV